MTALHIVSRTTAYRAELNDHPRGVAVELQERPTAPGSKYRRLDVRVFELPFHVVRDRVYDMLREL